MNIVTKKVKFKTLIICVTVILVLIFQSVYIHINTKRLEGYAYDAQVEAIETYHSYLSDNFSICMQEIDRLRLFIARNALVKYAGSYLNLIDDKEASQIVEQTEKSIGELSISDTIVSDFIVFGNNINQKNLYCNVENKSIEESKFPTVDLLEETGLDGSMHTNLGYIVQYKETQKELLREEQLEVSEREAVENLLSYLENEYVVFDYINGCLTVIRLNKTFVEEKFQLEGADKFIVYHSSGRPVLMFNTDETYASTLLEETDLKEGYFEDADYCYRHSSNLYGKLGVITETEKEDSYFSFAKRGYIYIVFGLASVGISMFFMFLFSNEVFKKMEQLHASIRKQTKSKKFEHMELSEKKRFQHMTFSKRLLLTFLASSLVSLALVTAVFHVMLEWETRKIAENLGKQLSRNYANECMIRYERYNHISTTQMKVFLEKFNRADEFGNVELTKALEEKFYYETTFLPGYLYAFIIDDDNEVLYQTVFSSQKQMSSELIRNAVKSIEKTGSNGVFVPVNDLLSGKQALAFVKEIPYGQNRRGAVVIVSDVPGLATNNINRTIVTDVLIVDAKNKVLVGETQDYQPVQVDSTEQFDSTKKILYSVNDSTEQYLGKCVLLTYYNFYLNQIRAIQYESLLWMLVIGVICILVTFVLRKIFVTPFSILMNNMNATPEYGYHTIPESFAIDEIEAIAVSYNKMINRIEKLVEEDIRKEQEKRELELLHTQTEYKMLEQQMNPHFLFNTLECVNLLAINCGEKNISKIVKSLSMILRYSLSKERLVTVRREIQVLQSYIEIQNFRFRESFQINLNLDESLFELQMIKFVLQPILENAISHGMSQTISGGKIDISLGCYEEGLEFIIRDNGVGMSEEALEKLRRTLYSKTEVLTEQKGVGGLGLRNVYRRIELLYRGKGDFIVNSAQGEGTEVVVRLPFEIDVDPIRGGSGKNE